MLMEHDGPRTRITTRKRVRRERRIAATKRDGLLVDRVDLEEAQGTKVPAEAVFAAIVAAPGLSYVELGKTLTVSKDTATRYAKALGDRVEALPTGPRGAVRLYPTAAPPQTTAGTEYGGDAVDVTTGIGSDRRTAASTCIGAAVPAAVVELDEEGHGPSAFLEGALVVTNKRDGKPKRGILGR